MKNLIIAVAFLLPLAGIAQTKPGAHFAASIAANNVQRDGLLGTLTGEIGYSTKHVGLYALANTTTDFNKASSYGLKATVKIIRIDSLHIWGGLEASRYGKTIDKKVVGDYSYKAEIISWMPLGRRFDVGFGPFVYAYEQYRFGVVKDKFKVGAKISASFRLF